MSRSSNVSSEANRVDSAIEAFHRGEPVCVHDAADRAPAVVVCEMLDDETGLARPPADAAAYAEANGLPFVEGADLVARFNSD